MNQAPPGTVTGCIETEFWKIASLAVGKTVNGFDSSPERALAFADNQ
jgi:hypothetical protein